MFDAGQYEEAIDAFIMMNGYKDSVSYIQQANAEIEKAEQYSDAISAMNTGTIESVNRAKNMFEELDDYKDSAQLAEECSNLLKDAAFQTYNNALALMDAQKYKTAWERFSKYPEYADSSEKMQECMAALFSEAEQLYKDKDYRPAFLLFEFCRSNAYSASKAKEKMDKCNDAYVSSLLGGKWIDEDAAFPLYSHEKHITVYSIQYRYVGNKIEFSVSYSIKKTGNYTGTYGDFWGESSPYFTDFGQCNLSLTGSSFTLSVDYDALMRGFRDGDFDRAILSMGYQLTSNYYDGFDFYFSQEDLEKTDLYGNLI